MGVTAGEIIATAILMIMYFYGRDKKYVKSERAILQGNIKELMSIRIAAFMCVGGGECNKCGRYNSLCGQDCLTAVFK